MTAPAGTLAIGELQVARLGFGAMQLTGPGTWGPPRDPAEARAVLRRAVELGVTLLDTADAYGPETSEQQIAEALYPYPAELVVATKGGFVRPAPGRWAADGRPAHLRRSCEASLRRLRLDRIDLYQLHAVDPRVPLEESVGALVELVAEGKIRHVGVCNVDERQLERAIAAGPVVSVQNRLSLAERASEPLVERCAERGLAFIAWAPLAKGFLADAHGMLARVAARHGATPVQVALAWLLHRSPAVAVIPGTASVGHLEENVAAAAVELRPPELEKLGKLRLPAYRARRLARRARATLGTLGTPLRGSRA
jgi:aryl-alcohol dehydrogenase-like predicted oxidoreductase